MVYVKFNVKWLLGQDLKCSYYLHVFDLHFQRYQHVLRFLFSKLI